MFLEHLLCARFIRRGGQALYIFPFNPPDNPVTPIVYLNRHLEVRVAYSSAPCLGSLLSSLTPLSDDSHTQPCAVPLLVGGLSPPPRPRLASLRSIVL